MTLLHWEIYVYISLALFDVSDGSEDQLNISRCSKEDSNRDPVIALGGTDLHLNTHLFK